MAPTEKTSTQLLYNINIADTCVGCKSGKYPLHPCKKFRSLPHGKMMAILKEHGHCIDCLKPGHFVEQCPCGQKCRKCQKPHHTGILIDKKAWNQTKRVLGSKQMPGTVTHHPQLGGQHPVVLTECYAHIVNTDGSTTKARTLLDSAPSTSFIVESWAQHLHLQRWCHFMKVGDISMQFCNPTSLMRNGGSQHIKSLWKDSGSGSSSATQSHHQSAILSGLIQLQMEAFVKYPSGWPSLWHPRECWSSPRTWQLQPYNASRPVVWCFTISS